MAFKSGKEQRTIEVDVPLKNEAALFEDDGCDLERYINECTARNPDFPRLMEQARNRLRPEQLRLSDDGGDPA